MSTRIERLQQQFQQEIAWIIQRELKDPRMGFVTVTAVTLSKDLSHGKVHYSCLGGEEEKSRSQEALDNSAGFIREMLKRRLRLKTIPELMFRYDESIAGSIILEDRFDQLRRKPDAAS